MDQTLLNLVLGVVSNAVFAVLAGLGRRGWSATHPKTDFTALALKDDEFKRPYEDFESILSEAVGPSTEEKKSRLIRFLSSPEADAVGRHLFETALVQADAATLESVEEEFSKALAIFMGPETPNLAEIGRTLFQALVSARLIALRGLAAETGSIGSVEALSSYRHHAVMGELQHIARAIDVLGSHNSASMEELIEFESAYRRLTGERHALITPPQWDSARRVPIDSIYVPPRFFEIPENPQQNRVIPMDDFIRNIYRTVVLGNPGGGKSTFSSKLCYELANHYDERPIGGRRLTPVLVVLRDFGAERKQHKCSIKEFIENHAKTSYQLDVPTGAFDYLLSTGRVCVIFDGLDELLDTTFRREITSEVESFSLTYPSVPVLVTSREVGYEQAPLDERRFAAFGLAPMSPQEVQQYVTNWFSCEASLTPNERKTKISAFLAESSMVEDLRSNPLMLGLMCNIYRGEGYIPKNRPDVYEKCAVMLFEKWDKSRGIALNLAIESHINWAMQYLAFWIYRDERLQAGVTEFALVEKATEYLFPRRFEDIADAKKAAEEFIEFCRGRAWVFTDTGTNARGDRLYQFTHRTFLEYFSAAHITRIHESTEGLYRFLSDRISRREWDVVAQLSVQLRNRGAEGAGDGILELILGDARSSETEKRWNLLSFGGRSLGFLVPAPRVVRELARSACELSVEIVSSDGDSKARYFRRNVMMDETGEPVGALLSAAAENSGVVIDEMGNYLVGALINEERQRAISAARIACRLADHASIAQLRHGIRIPKRRVVEQQWLKLQDRILDSGSARLQELGMIDWRLAAELHRVGRIPLAELLDVHGPASVFSPIDYPLSGTWPPLAWMLLGTSTFLRRRDSREMRSHDPIADLESIGNWYLADPVRWAIGCRNIMAADYLAEVIRQQSSNRAKANGMSADVQFGGFVLIATAIDREPEGKRGGWKSTLKRRHPLTEGFRQIMYNRLFEPQPRLDLDEQLEKGQFSPEQVRVIKDWGSETLSMTEPLLSRSGSLAI
jgi:hypothetical protein